MLQTKVYDLFISYAWTHHADYHRLVKVLDSAPMFSWENCSLPRYDPEVDPSSLTAQRVLWNALQHQIQPAGCFVLLSGMYEDYKQWIQTEIKIAKTHKKPIIGVLPWLQTSAPKEVEQVCEEIVSWNTGSIVNAIRTWAL